MTKQEFKKQFKECLEHILDNYSDAYSNKKNELPYYEKIWDGKGIDMKFILADYDVKETEKDCPCCGRKY